MGREVKNVYIGKTLTPKIIFFIFSSDLKFYFFLNFYTLLTFYPYPIFYLFTLNE